MIRGSERQQNRKHVTTALELKVKKNLGETGGHLTSLGTLLVRASTIQEQCYWKREEIQLLWWQKACYRAIAKRIPW